jgi:hypothetical protein
MDTGYFSQYLRYAIKWSNYDTVSYLLHDIGIDPSLNDQKTLQLVCKYGNLDLLEYLLSNKRIDLNSDGTNKCLRIDVEHKQTNTFERLLMDLRTSPTPQQI